VLMTAPRSNPRMVRPLSARYLRRLHSSSDNSRKSLYPVVNAETALRKARTADQNDCSDGERECCNSRLREANIAGRQELLRR
jgi:hypothetical protein